jgi:hypothetical protein
VLLLISGYLRVDSCLQEKRAPAASRDNLDGLYRDASNSLTILERNNRFTMADLDHHHHELQVSVTPQCHLVFFPKLIQPITTCKFSKRVNMKRKLRTKVYNGSS